MRKYFSVLRTSFKQESKTIGNTISAVISFCVIIFIFNELWGFIYGKNSGMLINGYSLKMMLWYMIMAEVLFYAINARVVTQECSNDIKSGKVAYQMNKPYNYFFYQVFSQCGTFLWKLLFLVPAAILMGLILVGPIHNFSVIDILPILFSMVIAALLNALVYGTIGLLAFFVEEATPFTWIIQKFVMIFGLFFPPEFFPNWLQPIIEYSPVYAMTGGPCKLIANFSWDLFLKVSISQAVYLAITIAIGLLIYNLGKKKVNMNGG